MPGTSSTDPQLSAPLTPTQYDLAVTAAHDLAERRSANIAEITVIEVEEVTWPDASLGCPQKGLQAAQVLTPGIRILLELDGQSVSYHAGAGRDPFYCATPRAPTAS
ncbi:MAG: hypothetical protein GXP35_17790 [Actinobacteria bacterium]|nr:hypothetical protein [Actinomycetota bacterium]